MNLMGNRFCCELLARAGAVGFEPTGVLPPLVFKTSAFVRSAMPPYADYTTFGRRMAGGGDNKTRATMALRPQRRRPLGAGDAPPARHPWAASDSRARM